jgi:plastocyanin
MRIRLLAAFCALILLVGCRTESPPDGTPVGPAVEDEGSRVIAIQREPMEIAQQMAGQKDIVKVEITDAGFEPRRLHASLGQRVKLHVRNTGAQVHNFVVERFAIATRQLAPGEESYVEFTVNATGEWLFFSDAPGQREPSLKGYLKVE